jgi:hypothetical protein
MGLVRRAASKLGALLGLPLAAIGFGAVLALPAQALVTATADGYDVSYQLNLSGTLNGSPVTNMLILETDGIQVNAEFGFLAAPSGTTSLNHTIDFLPTSALVIGLDLAVAGVGDGKDHLVILMDGNYAEAHEGELFSQFFPAIGGQPRLGHNALMSALLSAEGGDVAALQTVTDFFLTGAGSLAAFDPAGGFRVLEFTVGVPIDVAEPASALLVIGGAGMLSLARRRRPKLGVAAG